MSSLDAWKSELNDIYKLLHNELQQERVVIDQVKGASEKEVANLTEMLEKEKAALFTANREIEKLTKANSKLSIQVQGLESKCSQQSKQTTTVVTAPSFSKELEVERRRRIKAEQELEILRKQGAKTPDEQVAANARRVAIVLAQRCAELCEELERVRDTSKQETPSIETSVLKPVDKSSEKLQVQAVKAGWGLDDDDDMFAGMS